MSDTQNVFDKPESQTVLAQNSSDLDCDKEPCPECGGMMQVYTFATMRLGQCTECIAQYRADILPLEEQA